MWVIIVLILNNVGRIGMTKKIVYWVIGIIGIMQLIRPDFTNPKVDQSVALQSDPKVMNILKTSCYDCHSNETHYPWYHSIAPVSWVMSSNIEGGRKAINFSNWANIDEKIKLERLKRAKQLVGNELMPKGEYLMMHKNAVLKPDEKKILENFFETEIQNISAKSETAAK